MALDPAQVDKAFAENDAQTLARHATAEELERLRTAEQILQLARERKRNTSRWALVSQVMVSVVAAIGMLVNAYQSYANKQAHDHQANIDEARWNKEFSRAQRADKYRAFFETSVLATDPSNPDKRLVGYALLQEFVADEDYNSKATLMLEESLAQELRGATGGVEAAHRNAVVAIVSALSQTNDCHALERAAHTIDRVAQHHKDSQDAAETKDIFRLYVRRLLGRAAQTCKSPEDFFDVRRPLAQTLLRLPELADATTRLKEVEVNQRLVSILIEECRDEIEIGRTECVPMIEKYGVLCSQVVKPAEKAVEGPACEAAKAGAKELATIVAAAAAADAADDQAEQKP